MAKKQKKPLYYNAQFPGSVASDTECTGITPIPPVEESESESYQTIYDIPMGTQNKNQNDKKCK